MKAILLKVHPVKSNINGNSFRRIEFTMDDGSWAKTDVCPNFRNYARWKPIIKADLGTHLRGLRLKTKGTVDADSFPGIISRAKYEKIHS